MKTKEIYGEKRTHHKRQLICSCVFIIAATLTGIVAAAQETSGS
jgi:hypothetical protein